jgi:hypothetical protein
MGGNVIVVRRTNGLGPLEPHHQHELCMPRSGGLRRSLACTTVRRVTRNVKRWSSPSMALRWTAAAMHEAKKGFPG